MRSAADPCEPKVKLRLCNPRTTTIISLRSSSFQIVIHDPRRVYVRRAAISGALLITRLRKGRSPHTRTRSGVVTYAPGESLPDRTSTVSLFASVDIRFCGVNSSGFYRTVVVVYRFDERRRVVIKKKIIAFTPREVRRVNGVVGVRRFTLYRP